MQAAINQLKMTIATQDKNDNRLSPGIEEQRCQ